MKLVKCLILICALVTMVSLSRGADKIEVFSNGNDPSASMMWKAMESFNDASVTLPQLITTLQAITIKYPTNEYQRQIKHAVDILKQSIAENEAHAEVSQANLNRLPLEDRVGELIFQLRNQNNKPRGSIYFDQHGNTNTAANQLVVIGYPAVPRLIVALDSPIFTRSLGGTWFTHPSLDQYGSFSVLTVGDCAKTILQSISGKSFTAPPIVSDVVTNDNNCSVTRRMAEAWWNEFQKKGEKQMLIEGTEAGDSDSPTQAGRLLDRYPEIALASLIKGARAATDSWTEMSLMRMIGKYNSPEAVDFLLTDGLRKSQFLAAAILNDKGRTEGVDMVIREWEKSSDNRPEMIVGPNEFEMFLAGLDSAKAMEALEENFQTLPLNARQAILQAVSLSGSRWYHNPQIPQRSIASKNATEKFLVATLRDVNPGISDTAGDLLHQFWPERYAFNSSATFRIRERQRIECQNVWRQAHQLALLPLPTTTTFHVSTNEAVKVTDIVWEADSVKPTDAFAARVEAFKGKLLTATNYLKSLSEYAAQPESGTSGIVFNACRDNDLTGVTLFVCLLPGTPPKPNEGCHVEEDVILGQKYLNKSGGGGALIFYATDYRAWDYFSEAVSEAIASPPEIPFTIKFRLVSEARYMTPQN
jgi:hypothetical protein